jgi:hypothetical protein
VEGKLKWEEKMEFWGWNHPVHTDPDAGKCSSPNSPRSPGKTTVKKKSN